MKFTMFRSVACILLALLTVIGLCACGGNNDTPIPTLGKQPTQAPTKAPTEEPTETPDDPDEPSEPYITVEQLKSAQIVIPKNSMIMDAEEGYLYAEICRLKDTIRIQRGVELEIVQDHQPETEVEILIGETNRAATKELFADLLYNDYGYGLTDTKIVIRGGSDSALRACINEFTNRVASTKLYDHKDWFCAGRQSTLKEGTYPAKDATINGIPLSSYQIVYPAASEQYEEELAERLSNRLMVLTGKKVAYYSDATEYDPEIPEILIGKTNRSFAPLTTDGAAIETDENFLALIGTNAYEHGLSQQFLMSLVEGRVGNAVMDITLPAKTEVTDRTTVTAMGWNIYGVTSAVYRERALNICRMVTKYLPDIVAFQEPAANLMQYIHMEEYYGYEMGIPRHGADVPALSPEWPGANSFGPILYAKDRYEVVESGTKWMTETPDEVSRLPGSDYYRIYTYVLFHDKVTDERFVFVNHHLDFDPVVQVTTMKYMYQFLKATYTDVPIIMAGDFNAGAGSKVIAELITSPVGKFTDVCKIADRISHASTGSIDFIFATACCVSCRYFTMCYDTYPDLTHAEFDNKMPSDHPATYAELDIHSKNGCQHNWSAAASFSG